MGGCWLCVHKEVVYLAGAVVNEADHQEIDRHLLIGRRKMCSMALCFVAFEEDATDNGPYDRGVGATLAGAVYGEELAVCVEFLRDAKDSLQFVLCFLIMFPFAPSYF